MNYHAVAGVMISGTVCVLPKARCYKRGEDHGFKARGTLRLPVDILRTCSISQQPEVSKVGIIY